MQIVKRVLFWAALPALLAAQPGNAPGQPGSAPSGDDPPARAARLSFLDGNVSYRPGGEENWAPATLNYPLVRGDFIWADTDGHAEMHIGSTALRIPSSSGINFLNLDDKTAQVQLSEGSLSVRIRHLEPGDAYEVDTPNLAATLTAPGDYRIYASAEASFVIVRSGKAEVQYGANATVSDGQMLRVAAGDNPTAETIEAPAEDEWDQWCRSREEAENTSQSARYVSQEMTGAQDLDQHGDWEPQSPYGALWYPRGVETGWAPYRNGHWAWVEPWGWTWVDYAPWGFAPFHYGRWVQYRGRWAWAPGRMERPVYAPALVAFVGGSDGMIAFGGGSNVGWFPLGPNEPYQPGYGASAMYIGRLNYGYGARVGVGFAYANRGFGITVVSQSVFVGATPVYRNVVVVPRAQLDRVVVIGGGARIAPRHESIMGFRSDYRGRVMVPPSRVSAVVVVTRRPVPPPRVSFAVRETYLREHPGRPVDSRTLVTLRARTPVAQTYIRPVPTRGAAPVVRPRGYQPAWTPPSNGANRPGGGGGNRPAGYQPAGNRPADAGGNRPGGNQPGGYRPPSSNQPGGNRPADAGGNRPGGNQPGGYRPPASNPPGGNRPADAGGSNRPGGYQPSNNRPGGNQPNANRPPDAGGSNRPADANTGGRRFGNNPPADAGGSNRPSGNQPAAKPPADTNTGGRRTGGFGSSGGNQPANARPSGGTARTEQAAPAKREPPKEAPARKETPKKKVEEKK